MSRQAWWKEALAPAADLVVQLVAHIEGLSDSELTLLIRAIDQPGRTNCGWAIYQAAQIVRPIALRERRRREWLARTSPEEQQR